MNLLVQEELKEVEDYRDMIEKETQNVKIMKNIENDKALSKQYNHSQVNNASPNKD